MGRRNFLKQTFIGGAATILPAKIISENDDTILKLQNQPDKLDINFDDNPFNLDLAPAQWIWLPSLRTLPNTILLFRKKINISKAVESVSGYILGESRYKLLINNQRIQWGPAPADPRWAEADPITNHDHFIIGENIIGVEVLFYGFGDGTWPIGKPGFIFKMDIKYQDGTSLQIISDESWKIKIAESWKPGNYKRWYLRSFQEMYDARLYPDGWLDKGYNDDMWINAQLIPGGKSHQTSISSWSKDYLYDSGGNIPDARLRKRSIRMMKEEIVPIKKLSDVKIISWKIPSNEYFDFAIPDALAYSHITSNDLVRFSDGEYAIQPTEEKSCLLTFEMEEQHIGWPFFTIEAEAGTIIELLVHEAHDINHPHPIMNTHFHSWSRFICKEGVNYFEEFDYESLRFIQLHIHNYTKPIKVSKVGMRRRVYDYQVNPKFECGDPKHEKLFKACVNTIYNQSQETIVDGMARERQQYSGDLGHVLHVLMHGFGAYDMVSRFCNTYSQGLTKSGFFLDTWPAYDRLARLFEREIGMTEWGPILDHSIGFNFDVWHFYMHTGDITQLKEVYPRLKVFYNYLDSIMTEHGTLKVEHLGIPYVWIDHLAYKQQKHKECAFTLYAAAMLKVAFPALARAFKDEALAKKSEAKSKALMSAIMKRFWSASDQTFIVNKPWLAEEKNDKRMCDRSLAMAIIYDMVPQIHFKSMSSILATKPSNMGLSYPTNLIWRFWALAKTNRMDILHEEYITMWYNAPSVQLNNTLGEFMDGKTDSNEQWSHASISPIITYYMNFAGITITEAGYKSCTIEPKIKNLPYLKIDIQTPHGEIKLDLKYDAKSNKNIGKVMIPLNIKARFKDGDLIKLLNVGENII
jgi:alpha-L-rhamnosidase